MKLWLDDIRTPPDDTWLWVKTAEDAITWLKTGSVTEASLDHDLAMLHYASALHPTLGKISKEMTGYDVVKWMVEHNVWPRVVRVHSMNPVGAAAMRQLIQRWKPET